MGDTMNEDILTPVKDSCIGLISLEALALVTAQLPTSKHRYRVTIISCDPVPTTEGIEAKVLLRDVVGVE